MFLAEDWADEGNEEFSGAEGVGRGGEVGLAWMGVSGGFGYGEGWPRIIMELVSLGVTASMGGVNLGTGGKGAVEATRARSGEEGGVGGGVEEGGGVVAMGVDRAVSVRCQVNSVGA